MGHGHGNTWLESRGRLDSVPVMTPHFHHFKRQLVHVTLINLTTPFLRSANRPTNNTLIAIWNRRPEDALRHFAFGSEMHLAGTTQDQASFSRFHLSCSDLQHAAGIFPLQRDLH